MCRNCSYDTYPLGHDIVEPESDILSCLCGKELVFIQTTQAYKGKKVYCDICSKRCKGWIYHCPKGFCKEHIGGFDLCQTCGGSQNSRLPSGANK